MGVTVEERGDAFQWPGGDCQVLAKAGCLSLPEFKHVKQNMATISRSWIANNLEAYKQMLEKRPSECLVSYESFNEKEANSPLLSEIPSKCTHFMCKECWEKMASTNAE